MKARLEQSLKKQDLRITSARQTIFEILSESPKALSPKDVCELIDEKSNLKADHASVYRNLTLFTQIGLVHRFQDGKYSVCQHNEKQHHHLHIVANCIRCGKTQEIQDHSDDICHVAKQLKNHMGSFGHFSGLTLEGLCHQCS